MKCLKKFHLSTLLHFLQLLSVSQFGGSLGSVCFSRSLALSFLLRDLDTISSSLAFAGWVDCEQPLGVSHSFDTLAGLFFDQFCSSDDSVSPITLSSFNHRFSKVEFTKICHS